MVNPEQVNYGIVLPFREQITCLAYSPGILPGLI